MAVRGCMWGGGVGVPRVALEVQARWRLPPTLLCVATALMQWQAMRCGCLLLLL